MKKLFIGCVFVFIDFSLNLNGANIGLIPDFIGYFMLASAFAELSGESDSFSKIRPLTVGGAVYSLICWLIDIFGGAVIHPAILIVLSLINVVIFANVIYAMINGIGDMEKKYGCSLNSETLNSRFVWCVLMRLATVVFTFWISPDLALILAVVSLIVSITFLVALNETKTKCESIQGANLLS